MNGCPSASLFTLQPQLFLLTVLLHDRYGKDPEKNLIIRIRDKNKKRFFSQERERLKTKGYDGI